jgi:hypothetical protein
VLPKQPRKAFYPLLGARSVQIALRRLPARAVCYFAVPSPTGRGWRAAPGEGSPLHDFASRRNRGAGFPHPALRATFSPREKDSPSLFVPHSEAKERVQLFASAQRSKRKGETQGQEPHQCQQR